MESNELRIGNKVLYKGKKVITISQVNEDYVGGKEIFTANMDEVSGIQLTHEILLKAGFKYREHLKDYYMPLGEYDQIMIVSLRFCTVCVCASNSKPAYYTGLTCLHTLQNYYHALTSTELKIEL